MTNILEWQKKHETNGLNGIIKSFAIKVEKSAEDKSNCSDERRIHKKDHHVGDEFRYNNNNSHVKKSSSYEIQCGNDNDDWNSKKKKTQCKR